MCTDRPVNDEPRDESRGGAGGSTGASAADPETWQLGEATVFVVGEGGASGAATEAASETQSAQTQTFSCPSTVDVVGQNLPSGWERRQVRGRFVTASALGNRLACQYEGPGNIAFQVDMQAPQNGQCSRSGGTFTCTVSR